MEIEGKTVELFPADREAPLVILHTVMDEGASVREEVQRQTDRAFSLLTVGDLRWGEDMSPWAIPPVMKGDDPCTGGAGRHLDLLIEKILPEMEERMESAPTNRILAGYSLAGLFAVYSLFQTDIFDAAVSASGSFWYPDFLSYVRANPLKRKPKSVYFSLGDQEAKTRNPVLRTVRENTAAVEEHFRKMGIHTIFEENPGNHFKNATERMAKGIVWSLNNT